VRLKRTKRSARQRARANRSVAAYTHWRRECAAVWNAYRRWVGASAAEKASAFDAYHTALDREERAATRYAQLAGRAGFVTETGTPHQLASSR
jgi:hypothetical protein